MRKTQRLDKILSNLGYGTRKEIKKIIKDGAIKVGNKIVKDEGTHVDPVIERIEINGEELKYREFIYIMMNKPQGIISATFDNKLKTVLDLLPENLKCFNPFPVGRLDIDTVGLLLLTNDGQLAHELLSPKKHVPKRYFARVSGKVTEEDIELFRAGITLDDGYKTLPSDLYILHCGEFSEIELVIYEGKFHQVKRMFDAVEKKVIYLKRIEMGPLKLDQTLVEGSYRELEDQELEQIKDSIRS